MVGLSTSAVVSKELFMLHLELSAKWKYHWTLKPKLTYQNQSNVYDEVETMCICFRSTC